MKRDYKVYISDMVESILNIRKYVEGITCDQFAEDRKTQDAVIRNFEILGEAVKHIPTEFKKKYSEIPWKTIAGLRDKVIHEYFGVELSIVWKTIEQRLPELLVSLQKILKEI